MTLVKLGTETMEMFVYMYRCEGCNISFSFLYDPDLGDKRITDEDPPRYCPYCGIKTTEVQVKCTLSKY